MLAPSYTFPLSPSLSPYTAAIGSTASVGACADGLNKENFHYNNNYDDSYDWNSRALESERTDSTATVDSVTTMASVSASSKRRAEDDCGEWDWALLNEIDSTRSSKRARVSAGDGAADPFHCHEVFDCLTDAAALHHSISAATTVTVPLSCGSSVTSGSQSPLHEISTDQRAELIGSLPSCTTSPSLSSQPTCFPLLMSLETALVSLDPSLLSNMASLEYRYHPHPRYMSQHPQLDWSMRPVLFDWLMEVAAEFRLQRETFHLSLNYLERYLSLSSSDPRYVAIDKLNYQLLGITCLFIACKMEESRPPACEDLARTTDGACQAQQINEMEKTVLTVLGWSLRAQTPVAWLATFTQMAVQKLDQRHQHAKQQHGSDQHCAGMCSVCAALDASFAEDLLALLSSTNFVLSSRFVDLMMFELNSLNFYPSALATSALLLVHSHSMLRLDILTEVSGYSLEALQPALVSMQSMANNDASFDCLPVTADGANSDQLPLHQCHYNGSLHAWRSRAQCPA